MAAAEPANKEPTTTPPAANAPTAVPDKVVAPANDASNDASKEASVAQADSANESSAESEKNPVKRIVDEVVALMGDIHEGREELMARGIPFHNINALVELGVHKKHEDMAIMCKTAIDASQKQYGAAGITPELLDELLDNLVTLEKDLGHVRGLGREQGLDMNSINYLTMIIRQNPGDGGEKMINTFLAYTMACDIPLHRIEEILADTTAGPKSVLPQIPRDEQPDVKAAARKRLITDVCVGCVLAVLALTLLT